MVTKKIEHAGLQFQYTRVNTGKIVDLRFVERNGERILQVGTEVLETDWNGHVTGSDVSWQTVRVER